MDPIDDDYHNKKPLPDQENKYEDILELLTTVQYPYLPIPILQLVIK